MTCPAQNKIDFRFIAQKDITVQKEFDFLFVKSVALTTFFE